MKLPAKRLSYAKMPSILSFVLTLSMGGALISMISGVIAIADTPSQKTSKRELGFFLRYFNSCISE
ncbi:MAG TPA: hypothetical protein VLS85_05500 [Hanamia sp.]|nr:hypothetical protein [Hanamia sp.]